MKFKNKKIQVVYDSAILVDEWTDNNSFPYTDKYKEGDEVYEKAKSLYLSVSNPSKEVTTSDDSTPSWWTGDKEDYDPRKHCCARYHKDWCDCIKEVTKKWKKDKQRWKMNKR